MTPEKWRDLRAWLAVVFGSSEANAIFWETIEEARRDGLRTPPCYETLVPRHGDWEELGDGEHRCRDCGLVLHVEVVPIP